MGLSIFLTSFDDGANFIRVNSYSFVIDMHSK